MALEMGAAALGLGHHRLEAADLFGEAGDLAVDPDERKAIIGDAFARVDRQIDSLREKVDRLQAMIIEAEGRRAHLRAHLAEIESGKEPVPHEHTPATRRSRR